MPARRVTHTLPRLAVTLAAVSIVSVVLAAPAQAGAGVSSEPGTATQINGVTFRNAELARRITEAQAAYRAANERVMQVSEHSAALTAQAEEAAAEAERLYRRVHAQDAGGVVSTVSGFFHGDSDLDRAAEAADDAAHARQLADLAATAVAQAIDGSERARIAWETELAKARDLSVKQESRLAAQTAARQSRFAASYRASDQAQDALNKRAQSRWLAYLDSLAESEVVPPTAEDLSNPRRLADGLDPLRDGSGRVVPGVAEVDAAGTAPVVVLPAETIRSVSEAFSRVGLPDGADASGPAAYACGGLVARTWQAASTSVPADSLAQWRELHPVPFSQLQTGDLVVLGDNASGLTGSGVYLGDGLVIASDETDGQAAVRRVAPKQVYGARRATLPSTSVKAAPAAADCGLVATPASGVAAGSGPLRLPVADGSYTLSSGFGDSGELWSSGQHTGQDFAAPIGTPVYAAGPGTVSIEKVDWAGQLVRIDHGAGVETSYAHMSGVLVTDGETVDAGTQIGAVGVEGNTTGPHLHFEILLDGTAIDPMAVLAPTSVSATGPLVNGALPASSLCAATPDGSQVLRCDAAVGFRLMSAAYLDAQGTELCITDSYRSRDGQEQVFKAKPGLASLPGTSNHGWGIAVDLCGGIERFGTPQHDWLSSHGSTYGWVHPAWAAATGSKPEPWHFEFTA